MWPMVWAHLGAYLRSNGRDEKDLLFRTRTGRPLVWVEAKTEEELRNGTTTRKACNTPYKRSDSVWQAFRKLKKRAGLGDWPEGFYIWRHLGATRAPNRRALARLSAATSIPPTPASKRMVAFKHRMTRLLRTSLERVQGAT